MKTRMLVVLTGLSTCGLSGLESEITGGAMGACGSMYFHIVWKYGSGNSYKIGATRYQILRLKCTKLDFRGGSAHTLLGELTALLLTH